MTRDLIVVMAHRSPECEATVKRHLPFWTQHGAKMFFFCPADKALSVDGFETVSWGKAEHNGPESILRFKWLLRYLLNRAAGPDDRVLIFEYDAICLSREFPKTNPYVVSANAFYNRDQDERFKENLYCHPPLAIPVGILDKLVTSFESGLIQDFEGGYFWDRWFGRLCDVAGVGIRSFTEHTKEGYSQNTIEPAHRQSAIGAASVGARVFHGVKTPEILEAITLVSPWILHTQSPNGVMRRYVSFSLYGEAEMYRVGMRRNIELIKQYYPGWSCRIYMPPEMCGGEWHKEFQTWVKFVPEGIPPMFARFLIHDSPDCERFIVRDADSRIGPREKAAVDAWIASGQSLHCMRDHPAHCSFPICGGMWGGIGQKLVRPNMETAIRAWLRNHGGAYAGHDPDQKFLADVVYGQAASRIQHDSFSAKFYPGSSPFPTPFNLEETPFFVGEVYDEQERFREGDRAMILEALKKKEAP